MPAGHGQDVPLHRSATASFSFPLSGERARRVVSDEDPFSLGPAADSARRVSSPTGSGSGSCSSAVGALVANPSCCSAPSAAAAAAPLDSAAAVIEASCDCSGTCPVLSSRRPAGPSVGSPSRWSALSAGSPALPCAAACPSGAQLRRAAEAGLRGGVSTGSSCRESTPAAQATASRLPTARTSRPRTAARPGEARRHPTICCRPRYLTSKVKISSQSNANRRGETGGWCVCCGRAAEAGAGGKSVCGR